MQRDKLIKYRTLPNGNISYYLPNSGLAVGSISMIAIEGYTDSAFTVFKEDGKFYTRVTVKDKITKLHLPDIVTSLGKDIYLVA